MILSKAPLRVSVLGGGSDIPAHYKKFGGATLSMAIDKYVYVSLMETPYNHIKISYSEQELVTNINDIKNELIRETLKWFGLTSNIEITTFADIPTIGTGLGGSSSFVCALIVAIAKYKNLSLSKFDIADIACEIEILSCKHNIGKQDQYAAAFGGTNLIKYNTDDQVTVTNINTNNLDANCILIPTLINRKEAHTIIDSIDFDTKSKVLEELSDQALKMGYDKLNADALCSELNKAWDLKKTLSTVISNDIIDELYTKCIDAGAFGCKLLGAGGGGYMLALTDDRDKLKVAFSDRTCLTFNIAHEGARVVYYD